MSRQLRKYVNTEKNVNPKARFRWKGEHTSCCASSVYGRMCNEICVRGRTWSEICESAPSEEGTYEYVLWDFVCGALCWQCIYARAFEEAHRYSDVCCCCGKDWTCGCKNRWCLTPIGLLACLVACDGFTGPYISVGENDPVAAGMLLA